MSLGDATRIPRDRSLNTPYALGNYKIKQTSRRKGIIKIAINEGK